MSNQPTEEEVPLKVYVNGYGKRPFRIEEKTESPKQFKGSYKLPKNITRTDCENNGLN